MAFLDFRAGTCRVHRPDTEAPTAQTHTLPRLPEVPLSSSFSDLSLVITFSSVLSHPNHFRVNEFFQSFLLCLPGKGVGREGGAGKTESVSPQLRRWSEERGGVCCEQQTTQREFLLRNCVLEFLLFWFGPYCG